MKRIVNVLQKNSRLLYYLRNIARLAVPRNVLRERRRRLLADVDACGADEVRSRVEYCNRLSEPFALGPDARPLDFRAFRDRRNYCLDLWEYVRYFEPGLRMHYQFGDVTAVPPCPTLLKARPLGGDNRNAVLLNLNKVRHFVFVNDRQRFEDKLDLLVWRGNAFSEKRKNFLRRFHGHPSCDVGHAHRGSKAGEWQKPYLSIARQLNYKFVLSLEGKDVASNLKWIMSSNSLCFMPRPRHETWFMEGTLVPGVHYVMVRDDFSDLEEKMDHYLQHPGEALEIISHAHAHVERFRNRRREDLVSLMVLQKYFELSGQDAAITVN